MPAAADPQQQRDAWEAFLTEALRAATGDEPEASPSVPIDELTGRLRGGGVDQGELATRPYTIANLLLPADDPAPFGAYPRAFAHETEERLFRLLRSEVDAILIGVGTLRSGRYSRLLCEPGLRERRRSRGLTRDPLGVVISRSGHPPVEAPVFAESECEIAVFTSAPEPIPPCAARVHVIRMGAGDLTPRTVLARLRQEFGVRALLYEGGPTLLQALGEHGLLDEAFVTATAGADAGPVDAAAVHARTPLGELAEPTALWERQAGPAHIVRFRAKR